MIFGAVPDPDGLSRLSVASAAIVVLGLIASAVVFGYQDLNRALERDARMKAYMRECVALQSERRCYELWRWVEEPKT